jgi:sugar lactone lactonase YvrE
MAVIYTPQLLLPKDSSNYVYSDLSYPSHMAFDTSGNLYIAQYGGNEIVKLDSNGNFIRTIGTYGSGNGQLYHPQGVAVDSSGNIYVADMNNFRVQKLDSSGNFIWTASNIPAAGNQFTPMQVVLDGSGDIFVSDSNNSRILRLNSMGVWQETIGAGHLLYPNGLAFDSDGNLYVANAGSYGISVFSSSWAFLGTLGSGVFNYAMDVKIADNGHLFVTDGWNYRVVELDGLGNIVNTFGTSGSSHGQFKDPMGLVIDTSGNLYVSDYFLNNVQVFSASGSYIKSFGHTTYYTNPGQIFIDSQNNSYVADGGYQGDTGISKFDSNGNWLMSFGTYGSGNGQLNLTSGTQGSAFGFDTDLNIYIADTGNNRVAKFDSDGNWLMNFGSQGSGNGQFQQPAGLVVDASGNVFVLDRNNRRVQKFNSSGVWQANYAVGTIFNAFDIALDTVGHFYIADTQARVVYVFDSNFNVIRTITNTGSGSLSYPYVVKADNRGNIYIGDAVLETVEIYNSAGVWQSNFSVPCISGIYPDSVGNIYYSSSCNAQAIEGLIATFQVAQLSSPLDVITEDGRSIKQGTSVAYNVPGVPVVIEYSGVPVSSLTVDFTAGQGSDLDWSSVQASVDINTSKSVIANLNPVDAPGASATHTLLIPKLVDQTSVYICPNAVQLSDVQIGCAGGYTLAQGAANLSVQNISGQDYWAISGLTGTGGLGQSLVVPSSPLVLTPNNSAVSASQEVTMSYTPASGFVSGDKVQLHFEPTAGFVLANTCATPTTDSNADSTVDGSATIVGSDVYEYTFSGTVAAGPLSFCALVTSPATAGSYSVRLTDDNGSFGATMYYVGGDNEVFVIANVAPSLSFNIRTLDDSSDTNVCSFGTVSPSDTLPNYDNVDDGASECGYSLAVGTNAANGFQVQLTANHELSSTSASIAPITNGVGFVAGVEAYGLANVTSSTSGRNVTTGIYDQSILKDGNFNLGANTGTNIPLSATNFVSYTNGIQYIAGVDSLDTTSVMHGLVIGSGTPAGYYDQVLTYTTTANF